MQIKVFRAANLQAALEEIREQLGPNASVLKTRQCRDGWMGWLGRSYVEVTATAATDVLPSPPLSVLNASKHPIVSSVPIDARPLQPSGDESRPLSIHNVASARPTGPDDLSPADLSPLADYHAHLLSLGVARPVADRWIRATSGFVANLGDRLEEPWWKHLQRSVAREIRLSGPIQLNPGERRIVALIGPTGVGKTTTIAKLAAGFRLQSKRRVGLLTIDTFRIAAVQQLQAYAQIMDLPMSVVESADQMRHAIEQLGDVDLILIDTAGRSPKGDARIEGLADVLQTAQPDETHLVISATSTAAVVQSALDGFAVARPTAAILTKLDEAPYTAGVLSAVTSTNDFVGVPISYLTNGQHVPDDIAIATTEQLLARLLPTPIEMPQIEAA
ncbi:flagellar biosynthesis protein FlhF [Roseiconus nitratireducens]|uniref:Flagellar biosynthesis protein FlhF n=1 Tax=Roseiconus nitratireducens TaxID=2605748 RepID=A0A5M6DA50_9BACT|nr:flagellar biosynthesis protein FlhF [Roseiconus nitratireducens]KAA5544427.1 flagellar biosynthesis protein FlhF [Roseiconus nitratireducens]